MNDQPVIIQFAGARGPRGLQGIAGSLTQAFFDLLNACASYAASALAAEEDAEAAAINSEASAVRSELAAITAEAIARPFDNTAAGLAGTTNGQYFTTPELPPSGGIIIWKNVAGVAVQKATLASIAALATLTAQLEQSGPSLGFAGSTIDSLIVSALLDTTTGQAFEYACAGFGQAAPRYRTTPNGLADLDEDVVAANIKLAGGNVVVPAARVDTGATIIDCPAKQLTSPSPAAVTITDEPISVQENGESTTVGQYITSGTETITRLSDSHVLVEGESQDYVIYNEERGAVFGYLVAEVEFQGTACKITYQATKQRIDIITAGEDGVYTLTQGAEVFRAPAMWEPAIPAGHRLIWRGLRDRKGLDLAPVYRYRDTVEIGKEHDYWGFVDRQRQRIARFRAAMARRENCAIFAPGDSITQLGGVFSAAINTTPNGLRSAIGYFSEYDLATQALIPHYNFGDALGATHVREGFIWKPLLACYERYYGKDASAYVGWGDAEPIQMRNWGVGGTNSSADLLVDRDGTERKCMLQPDRLAAFIADVQAALNAGRHCLTIIPMGMNEYGSATTYDNFLTLSALCRALRSTNPAYADRRCEMMFMMPVQRSPLFRADADAWRYTCREIMRAGDDVETAIVDTSTLFGRDCIAAAGMSWRELCDASGINHPGIKEFNAVSRRVIHILC